MKAFALDGHDAAGKTTLAQSLAEAIGARYVRPFGGDPGRRLIEAYQARRHGDVLAIGREAILSQLQAAPAVALVLDRGWVTVATLVPRKLFVAEWDLWLPSALLWCDEATTIRRLGARADDENEPDDWHAHFLAAYLDRFGLRPGVVVRTDQQSETDSVAELIRLFEAAPPFDMPRVAA